MNIEQLKYIVEVSQTESISKAAENLHVSQPNISQAILNFEKEIGLKLFKRSRLGAQVTESGRPIIEKATSILYALDELEKIAKYQNNTLQGHLNVIAIPIIGLTFLPKTLSNFKLLYPNVQIEVSEDGSMHGIDCVLNGTADVGIISLRSDTELVQGVKFIPLLTSKTLAYVGKNSILAKEKFISLKEIVQHPIVMFNERYSSHNFMRKALELYGTPNILFSSGNSDAMRKVISENLAIGFYSDISLKIDPYILSNQIVPVRIIEEEEKYSTYGIIVKETEYLSIIAQKFIDELVMQANLFKSTYNIPDYSLQT